MTYRHHQLNREESNTIPIIEGCGTSGVSHARYRVMIHVGVIVNMRIRLTYIEKNNRRDNAIIRYRRIKAMKEGHTEV